MMNRNRYFLWILLALMGLTSCKTVSYISVELANPAKKELPAGIQSLTLVNRAVDERFANFNEDSLQQIFYRNQFRMDTLLLDSLAADTLVQALGKLLFESERYDVVIPVDRFLPHERSTFFTPAMDWEEVQSLCDTFHTDAVLSLDFFKTSVTTTYKRETLYDTGSENFYSAHFAQMQINYESLFRVYDPKNRQIVMNELVKDTLLWEGADYDLRTLFARLTKVKGGLIESGIDAALEIAEKIAPTWRTDSRPYFSKGDPVLEEAHLLVQSGDWDSAMTKWEELSKKTNSKALKSKAEFNLAVGSEMQGNIDNAIKWGVKSYETMYRPMTYDYLNTLKTRKQQLEGNHEKE